MVTLNLSRVTLWPKAALAVLSRFNLLNWTEDFSRSDWTSSGTLTTAVDSLTASGVLNTEIRQSVSRVTNGETVTFSIEARVVSGSAEWDMLVGEYMGGTLLSGTNQALTGLNGTFQRFSVTRTGDQALADNWRVRVRRTNAAGAAEGDEIEVRRAQLEVASSFTSYQKVNDGTEFS